jgi:hypothetical protein
LHTVPVIFILCTGTGTMLFYTRSSWEPPYETLVRKNTTDQRETTLMFFQVALEDHEELPAINKFKFYVHF